MTRILVFSPGDPRDQLLLFPSLTALSSTQIDVVVSPEAAEVYQLCPDVSHWIPFDFGTVNGLADWSNLYGIAREKEYDAALTVSSSLQVRFLLWLLGIEQRVGTTGGVGEFLLTHAKPQEDQGPRVNAYQNLLQVLPASPLEDLSLSLQEDWLDWSQTAYESLDIHSANPYMLCYDESGDHFPSRYPLESWSSVLNGLRDRESDLQPALLSSPHNQTWITQMQAQIPNLPVLRPQGIGQTAAVIHQAQTLVSADTTPLYLGLGTHCQVVGLFGEHKPDQYLPQNDRAVGLRVNSGQMKDIAPIQVIESVSRLRGT